MLLYIDIIDELSKSRNCLFTFFFHRIFGLFQPGGVRIWIFLVSGNRYGCQLQKPVQKSIVRRPRSSFQVSASFLAIASWISLNLVSTGSTKGATMTGRFDPEYRKKFREFLREYKRHVCLWDTKNAEYNNRTAKDDAKNEICRKFGLTEKQLRFKISAVRTTYYRIQQKIAEWAKLNEPYQPMLFWYFNHCPPLLKAIILTPALFAGIRTRPFYRRSRPGLQRTVA